MRDSGPEEIMVITDGRKKAMITHEAAFSPIVFVKISMPSPRKKERSSNNHFGVLKGSKRIK